MSIDEDRVKSRFNEHQYKVNETLSVVLLCARSNCGPNNPNVEEGSLN